MPGGAEDSEKVGQRLAEKAPNGSGDTTSNGSEEAVAAKEGTRVEEKPPVTPQASEMSKSKTALIMLSLMVSDTETGKLEILAWLTKALDCCLSCCSR